MSRPQNKPEQSKGAAAATPLDRAANAEESGPGADAECMKERPAVVKTRAQLLAATEATAPKEKGSFARIAAAAVPAQPEQAASAEQKGKGTGPDSAAQRSAVQTRAGLAADAYGSTQADTEQKEAASRVSAAAASKRDITPPGEQAATRGQERKGKSGHQAKSDTAAASPGAAKSGPSTALKSPSRLRKGLPRKTISLGAALKSDSEPQGEKRRKEVS